jgi:anhydro-N-acetylmuramic acid kinase
MNLAQIQEKPARFAIGLVSGPSCDGVDAVIIRVKGTGKNIVIKFIAYKSFPYPPLLKNRLLDEHLNVRDVAALNVEIGQKLAEAAAEMVKLAEQEQVSLDYIASFGHTIAHVPGGELEQPALLQIGEPAFIAEQTGLPVISDFPARDIAAGGLGGPLTPYADWLLFHDRHEEKTLLCIHVGGMARLTVVTPQLEDVIAFDTGPANIAIDGAVRLLSKGQRNMDRDGAMAAQGTVIDEFMEYLLSHPFFQKSPPRSATRQEFNEEAYLRDALALRKNQYQEEDLIATVTASVVKGITDAIEKFVAPRYTFRQIILGGGGAKNKTLVRMLRQALSGISVFTSDQYGIPDSARDAIAAAILGNETIFGKPASLPQATGARHAAVLGKITVP